MRYWICHGQEILAVSSYQTNHVLFGRITSAAADETERVHVVGRSVLPDRRREFPQNYVWIWTVSARAAWIW